MYTGARACRPVRASDVTGPIGIPIIRLARRVDGITEGYSVMGLYVRTGPRAFQQTSLWQYQQGSDMSESYFDILGNTKEKKRIMIKPIVKIELRHICKL